MMASFPLSSVVSNQRNSTNPSTSAISSDPPTTTSNRPSTFSSPLPSNLDDKGLEQLGLSILERIERRSIRNIPQPCDPIFHHPTTNAAVHCGGWSAANNLEVLCRHNIKRIVNCQDLYSDNFFEDAEIVEIKSISNHSNFSNIGGVSITDIDGKKDCPKTWMKSDKVPGSYTNERKPVKLQYLRFHVNGVMDEVREKLRSTGRNSNGYSSITTPPNTNVKHEVKTLDENPREKFIYERFSELFKFIDQGLAKGESVLIHCAAGMHRAGGVSVAYCMHRKRMNYHQALTYAKSKRGVIDPYHSELLKSLDLYHTKHGYMDTQG